MDIDPTTTTKSNKPRKGKANITARRYQLRQIAWNKLKFAIQQHLAHSPKGEANRMARACGISASQIHRFTCPKCEHDQEPAFTVGFTLFLYLLNERQHPVVQELNLKPDKDGIFIDTPKLQRCNK